jgi:hypothetical protein
LTATREQASKLNSRLAADVSHLSDFKKTCDDDMKLKIEEAHKNNERITKKLIQVYGKFEEYLSRANGSRGVFKAEHEALND